MTAHPNPSPDRGQRAVWIIVVLAAVLVLGIATGVRVLRNDDRPTDLTSTAPAPAPETTEGASQGPDTSASPTGTQDDPFAAGDPVTAGGWTTTIGQTDTDGWPALSSGLTDIELAQLAPPSGTSYVVAPMTVTYADGEPANLGSFEVSYVGASGTSYPVIGSTCRLALDDLFPTSDVYEQAEVTGTVCTDVPTSDAADGTWRVALNIYDDATSSVSKDYEGYVATS